MSTAAIWMEDTNMQNITARINKYLGQNTGVELVSLSHILLPNNRFSAFIALRDTNSATRSSGLTENGNITIPELE